MSDNVIADAWRMLARMTPARIALGRAGSSLPTSEVLRFSLAHARARDAVHAPFDAEGLQRAIEALSKKTLIVSSAAPSRAIYLRRPDLGRRLSSDSRQALETASAEPVDLALVIVDGLSAIAIETQALPFLRAFTPAIAKEGWRVAPVVIARQARVALGDEVGEILKARAVALLVGERPGLSSPDSLGIYLTYHPRIGRSDAERNCISNVRPEGLAHDLAAFKLAWLLRQALQRHVTGVTLKDESDLFLVEGAPPVPMIGAGEEKPKPIAPIK
jgi:ethanolamine ammonia-lyase small subunit